MVCLLLLQLLADLLFHPPHALFQASLLRNQLCCTLATLLAAVSLDTSLALSLSLAAADQDSAVDVDYVSQVCSETILPYQQSLVSIIETSNDLSKFIMYRYIYISFCDFW